MKDMLSQMRNAQKQMKEVQKKLESMRIVSETGGGTVKATVDGEATLVDLHIDASLLKEKEISMLPRLILKTITEAQKKAKKEAANSMKGMMGGMGIPGL